MNQNLDLYIGGDSWGVGPGHMVIDTLLYHQCTNVRRQFDCPAMFYYYLKLPIKVKKKHFSFMGFFYIAQPEIDCFWILTFI